MTGIISLNPCDLDESSISLGGIKGIDIVSIMCIHWNVIINIYKIIYDIRAQLVIIDSISTMDNYHSRYDISDFDHLPFFLPFQAHQELAIR